MALWTILRRKGITRNLVGLGLGNVRESHTLLPDLPYVYGALELFISRDIMQLHHQKHHQNYVTDFNQALKHHSIFWKRIAPVYKGGDLDKVIPSQFGSLDVLIEKINVEGADLPGSGWVWLAFDKQLKKLMVETTKNEYKNEKLEYLKNIWNVINSKYASDVYDFLR